MDLVIHIMVLKILHHHIHLRKETSKTSFKSCSKRGKRFGKTSNTSQPSNSRNQEEREDALLHEEDVENLNYKEVHECLEEVEEKNVDQEVADEDKESKGMEILQSASSEATPPKSPSKLHFEWVNLSDMNLLGSQHYGLLETDGQFRALCGVSDKKEMSSLRLEESRFMTCRKSKPKACSGHLHKLHHKRAKVGAVSLRKHLGP
ncbi:hypothetical protein PIB30_082741 [Stylosanthes scabra]|uniref:Uncharacterized protein n=1 Tax=Stylosanthes scabra TaxID=79078 RepID=A0ABU6RSG3_9FABA|nr:hypothetical protein [Stylosanthes scabra]